MTKEVICSACEGHGFEVIFGKYSVGRKTCARCNGTGLIDEELAEFIEKACKKHDPIERTQQTNGDRIRAMSDEELAKFITHPCECSVDPETDGYRECGNNLCIAYLLKWLKQPSEEGAEHGL